MSKNAPVVFVCENNLYGASTHISKAILLEDIAERAHSYGMPGVVVDGMDVEAVHQAAAKAVARARSGNGPTLLEAKTYRYSGHSRGDPCGYRDEEEVALWHKRDPLLRCRGLLADEYNVAVFVTNQVMADPGGGSVFVQDAKKPIGGHILAHASSVRMSLRKGKGETRILKIIQHPNMPEADANFDISNQGIMDGCD